MLRPFTWPPTTHAAATPWELAKTTFSALTARFGLAMRLASRRFLTPRQRRELIPHLEPIAELVRGLTIVEAITLPVMTPMGLEIRQITRPCRIPGPPPQVGAHSRIPKPTASRLPR